ncbi:MAG TPA: CHC2 zinc finger domain-containing protein [Anaerolineae bacterium]|nr:CHC2 zinc finger domain-containing protein [Anaerolineae bacterium]
MQESWEQRKERVRAANPIEHVAARYTQLMHAGRLLKARCPLHEENTPSFVVYPEQGRWWCYGACQTGGDVFKLVMLKEGLDFKSAVQFLNAGASPSIIHGKEQARPVIHNDATRESVFEITEEHYTYLTLAKDVYRAALASEHALLRYLDERRIDGEAVRRFHIGYADGEGLRRYFQFRGWKWIPTFAEELGLVRKDERCREREYFRHRLIIPDLDGERALYLVGRSTRPEQNVKYIGLSGVPKPLFGLAQLRARQRIFVCEGPFDWLTLKQWDLPSVCLLGAYLKKDLRGTLERFERVYVVTDFDAAGQIAARLIACELGARAAIVSGDPTLRGKDANELAQNYRDAAARFERLVERADARADASAHVQDLLRRLRMHLTARPERADLIEAVRFKLADLVHQETAQGRTVVLWARAYAERVTGKNKIVGRHVIRSVGGLRGEFLLYSARPGGKADAECNLHAAEFGEVIVE